MPAQLVLPDLPFEDAAMDYAFLRQEGIRHLERMAGEIWTDFNSHDPGITILEQICYALTDLAKRINYDVRDLLANAGDSTYASLPSPAHILTQNPLTLTDLRKVALDVEGVSNAWVDMVERADLAYEPLLHYQAAPKALRLQPNLYTVETIALKGLYRVQLESPDGDAQTRVIRRLQECRGLCEDFARTDGFKTLEFDPIVVQATVEIAAVDNVDGILREIYQRLAEYISLPVRRYGLAQRREAGKRVDEIFEGPWLERGFIDAEELNGVQRRTELRTSDMIREIMRVTGVKAVSAIAIANKTSDWQQWTLTLDPQTPPRLADQGSEIKLQKNRIPIGGDSEARNRSATQTISLAASAPQLALAERDLQPTPGRNRNVGRYYSLQHQFPAIYGVGAAGLAESAGAPRQAQAKQLKAYLLFFDQLLANSFAQLAHVGDLFSFTGHSARTYFGQAFWQTEEYGKNPNASLGLHEIVAPPSDGENGGHPDYNRTNRFLDHLLARFAEQLPDHSLVLEDPAALEAVLPPGMNPAEKLIEDKQHFLREYAQLGRARGTAYNYLLPPDPSNRSGLEWRLRRKLGLIEPAERFYLVEHILLRPLKEDSKQQEPIITGLQHTDPQYKDPYSLQLSFVFPKSSPRFNDAGFRAFVARTIREETPAHLTFTLRWFDRRAMEEFKSAYSNWQKQQYDYQTAKLESPSTSPANPFQLRATRDRLIDLLGIGQTYPLQDLPVSSKQPEDLNDPRAIIKIENSQSHVLYQLYEGDNPVKCLSDTGQQIPVEANGEGEDISLVTCPITQSVSFRMQAHKLPWYIFELDATFADTLQNSPVSEDLRNVFHIERGVQLATDAPVIPISREAIPEELRITLGQTSQPLEAWRIGAADNEQQAFFVINQQGHLNVYQFPNKKTFLLATVSIIEVLNPDLKAYIFNAEHLDLQATDDTDTLPRIVNYGASVTVKVEESQSGANYRLVTVNAQEIIEVLSEPEAEKIGNTDTIELVSKPLKDDKDIRIQVMRSGELSQEKPFILTAILPLIVRADPSVSVMAKPVIVNYEEPVTITVKGSQAGTTYQAYTRAIPDSDFVHGLICGEETTTILPITVNQASNVQEANCVTIKKPVWTPATGPVVTLPEGYLPAGSPQISSGGDLSLTIGKLPEDSLIIVTASREHTLANGTTTRSEVQLQQPTAVLVRPNAKPLLTIKHAAAGWEVAGGERGVFYYFRRTSDGEDLGLPAYFHKHDPHNATLNKGVGRLGEEGLGVDGLAIAIDFVVARPLPDGANASNTQYPPLDPLLEASQLQPSTQYFVRAVKAQTGVATLLSEPVQTPA